MFYPRGARTKLAAFTFTNHARPATPRKLLGAHTQQIGPSLFYIAYRLISQQRPESRTSIISRVILILSVATSRPNFTECSPLTKIAYTCELLIFKAVAETHSGKQGTTPAPFATSRIYGCITGCSVFAPSLRLIPNFTMHVSPRHPRFLNLPSYL